MWFRGGIQYTLLVPCGCRFPGQETYDRVPGSILKGVLERSEPVIHPSLSLFSRKIVQLMENRMQSPTRIASRLTNRPGICLFSDFDHRLGGDGNTGYSLGTGRE